MDTREEGEFEALVLAKTAGVLCARREPEYKAEPCKVVADGRLCIESVERAAKEGGWAE